MESVDRLRNYVEQVCGCNGGRHDIQAIADEIEREHRKALHEAIRNALANGKKSVLRQIADTHMPLPKDADGVPIHVDDELEPTDECGMRVTVSSIQFTDDGCWVFAGFVGRRPHKYRHVKPDTPDSWERIIEDVRSMDGCGSLGEFMERHGADFVARCKALAGEGA